jgi:hypothetical protein
MGNSNNHVREYSTNLRRECDRRQTFPKDWKYYDFESLARVGFVYTGYKDVVQCVFCKFLLQTNMVEDVTWIAHRRHRPKCPFMHGEDVGNIPLPLPIDVEKTRNDARYVSVDISDPVHPTQKTVKENPCVVDDVRKIDLLCSLVACLNIIVACIVLLM